MRKLIGLLLSLFLLCGCKADNRDVSTVMDLRTRLQKCQSCSFSATVTADYNTMVYKFTVDCVVNSEGDLTFTVMNPESISGITGVIGGKGGKLTFDGQMLAFDTLADGQIRKNTDYRASREVRYLRTIRATLNTMAWSN